MANVKITELPSLSGANSVSTDLIPVVDVSADITSSMTRAEFFTNIPSIGVVGASTITSATSTATLTITQTGAGNALVVEDAASPDSTPFVVTAAGNVGIGTTAPAENLDIQSSVPTIRLSDTDGSFSRVAHNAATLLLQADEGGVGTGSMNFEVGGPERMRIDSTGKVGIGLTPSIIDPLTNVSAGALQVNGNIELRYAGVSSDPAGARYFNIVNTDTSLVADQPLGGIQWIGLDDTTPNSNMASITSYCAGNLGTTGDLRFKIAGTERVRISNAGNFFRTQPTETSKSAATTLTITELLSGIVQFTGATIGTLTLPLGTSIEGGLPASATFPVDMSFDFSVINTGTAAGAVTITGNTGLTLVGSMLVPITTSGLFRVRKTATNTYTVYRIC